MDEGSRFTGVNPELFLPLTERDKSNPEWFVEVDGNIIAYTSGARFFNPKREIEWRLGRRSDGYVGVIGHEAGGGGTVIIPFAFYRGQLWIGLLTQERKTQGGNVLNVPRGYLDPKKTHFQNALEEMQEETGVSVGESRIIDLSSCAKPANPNSANYDTSRESEGVRFYAVEFDSEELGIGEVVEDRIFSLCFKPEIIKPVSGDKDAERIFGCRFYSWQTAVAVSDMFTNAALIRLIAFYTGFRSFYLP